MKIFSFNKKKNHEIEDYGSRKLYLSRISKGAGSFQIVEMNLDPNGVVGRHKAVCPQLFLVIAGMGWVSGSDNRIILIERGQGAFWEKDEWHEAGTATGMVAFVVEADQLDLLEFTEEK